MHSSHQRPPLKRFPRQVFNLLNNCLNLFNMRLTRSERRCWCNAKSPEIVHIRVVPNATYSTWRNDEAFGDCYNVIKDNTLVDVFRCFEL